MKDNYSLVKRVFVHCSMGALVGLLFLHPLSMFIHDYVEHDILHFIAFKRVFDPLHFPMATYFVILGVAFGLLSALYTQKRVKLYEEIRWLSITDELTSLYNRRYFVNQLKKEIERARRYSRNLSLLIIDIDNLKRYNDTYGHQEGDNLLQTVAKLLKNSVRRPDFVARYGGDEFVIVMPESDKDKALRLAERLRAEIEAYEFETKTTRKREKITISLGAATFPSEAKDIDELFTMADDRLYMRKGKEGGKEV